MNRNLIRKLLIIGAVLVALGGTLAGFAWNKFFREEPENWFDTKNEVERFKYGSVGGEAEAGIPYWIWYVLPRIFPDYLPGPGGYRSLGVTWEEGRELPVGFTKKVVGFPRVGNNCALCHAGTYRINKDSNPIVVAGAPTHSFDVQGMFRFLFRAAEDPRFNAKTILSEIDQSYKLSFIDRQIYRFIIIPFTRKKLRELAAQGSWIFDHDRPEWGRGRDDAFNLPKYFVASLPVDSSVGQSDFNSVWNMKARVGPNLLLNWGGETPSLRSVMIDSALGVGARPKADTIMRLEQLENFISNLAPPKYPFEVDKIKAAQGEAIYNQRCAECHTPGAPKTNRIIPIAEIGTDPERLNSWTQAAADAFNRKVREMGFDRPGTIKNNGYYSPPLDGIWMRAPYLHNGSVPNLREILEPPSQRTTIFYRGYDVYDPEGVGFMTGGADAERFGWRFDARVRGNGNQGHSYGVDLSPNDKRVLLEYLKTL